MTDEKGNKVDYGEVMRVASENEGKTWTTLGQYVRRLVRAAEIDALEWAEACAQQRGRVLIQTAQQQGEWDAAHDIERHLRAEIERRKIL